MAIVKMKKLRLVAVRSDEEELLREMMLLGCVQISDPERQLEDEEISAVAVRETSSLSQFKTEYNDILHGIATLGKFAPAKSPMLAPKPEVEQKEFLDNSGLGAILELSRQLASLDDDYRRLQSEENRQLAIIEPLRPWVDLDIPLEYNGTQHVSVAMGVLPITVSLDEFKASVYTVSEEVEAIQVSEGKEKYILIICMREALLAVMSAARENGFSPITFGSVTGSAKENIEVCEKRIAELKKEREELAAKIAGFSGQREEMKLCADRYLTKIEEAEVRERLLTTGSAITFEGWIPVPAIERVVETLGRFDCAWEMEDPSEDEIPDVPVMLKNNALSEPLMIITEMYSLPAYDGIDPNPLLMPFFTMFFGIMFADIGYGIILFLASHIILGKVKPKGGGMKQMLGLIRMCGVTTTIMGVITGGFFGDAIYQFSKTFMATTIDLPRLFSPLDDPIQVLLGSMCVGAVQILTGMFISMYMKTRDGHFLDALMDEGSWLVLFAGFVVGPMTGNWNVALAGTAAIVLTAGRESPTIIGKLVGGVGKLYDITAYFGDILSYSRLMTLMLAGGVIASVFNQIAVMPKNIIAFVLIFILGQTLNLGLNIIGTFVHTMRLQYLEYFGKFYKDGGKAFRPLKTNSKYVDVI